MFKHLGFVAMHHVVAIALLVYTIFNVERAHFASMALLLDFNALVQSLRRILDHPPFLDVVFWASFVFLRLVWLPCIAWGVLDAAYIPGGYCYAESGCYIPKFISSTPRVGVANQSSGLQISGLKFQSSNSNSRELEVTK